MVRCVLACVSIRLRRLPICCWKPGHDANVINSSPCKTAAVHVSAPSCLTTKNRQAHRTSVRLPSTFPTKANPNLTACFALTHHSSQHPRVSPSTRHQHQHLRLLPPRDERNQVNVYLRFLRYRWERAGCRQVPHYTGVDHVYLLEKRGDL